MTGNTFTLASQSPRRLELLQQIGYTPALVLGADIDETPHKNENARDLVERLAQNKALHISQNNEGYILAADTVVECRRQIFNKPTSIDNAQKHLQALSGRRHRVYTAVAFAQDNQIISSKLVTTIVQFKRLDQQDIDEYLEYNEWEDKAGSYGIQGLAGGFVRSISGSYSSVVGLPLYETRNILRNARVQTTK